MLKDFWNTAFITWLILTLLELFNPGWVQRFINLEYWFYALFFMFIIFLLSGQTRFHHH